ncbi:modular serine protease [Manduca sexta]|uniref:modular serine protease n=1 Tax=Manduca sexta TaxID=7130 RepID=UPI00188E7B9A|nr:modular serine protease [Manduca sexta]
MILLCLFVACFGVAAYAKNVPVPRVSQGYLVDLATAPWHVGLYRKTASSHKQICGGTIIAKRVVITAAHCVTKDRHIVLPASQFAVAAGKIYRLWNDIHDVDAQKSDVKEIKVPPRYQGAVTNYQHDIALLLLTAHFNYTDHVKPACLNFDPEFDEKQLQEGQWGKVVGWGLTGKNSRKSEVLQGATLQYITIDKCIEQCPAGFRSLITGDKICAGYKNGTAVCRGDSGGGLVLPEVVDGIEWYFLRGVISTSPTSAGLCNIYTWSTFTHLLQHEHFVKSVLPDVEKTCGIFGGIRLPRLVDSNQRSENCKCVCTSGT